ncbi:hypothetical protein INT47_000780 [Mucor saturninus]|uniref:DUF2421 domain-containing protein n=1 Tax=Mucor saturninus TaxID=64648 RepID=A0A8H7QGD1_9FUNG|nr:hypothetical protein INT47_000780 [Mucor saturninus]
MSSLESECTDPSPCQTKTRPSGIYNLFNNSDKPLNAFIITSKPPPITYTDTVADNTYHDFTPSSLGRSSAYFTASLPNSDSWSYQDQVDPSLYDLSRTNSTSSYLDNQSDYEVILDDGSRQKRTISLSTIKQISSRQHIPSTPSFIDNLISKDRRRHSKSKETTRLLPHDDKNLHMPLSLSSDSEDNDHDDDDNNITYPSKRSSGGMVKRLYRKLNQWQHHHLTLSHQQKMVLKCSFAYMIGSLFTFVPTLNALCGTHIASHMAATVTVFFNPAKSVGGMVEAAGFGWLYTLAALTLSIASMYTTDFFLEHQMPTTAAVISLGVWLAGSTFVISYLKAKINTPSILTASGLAFIILFTVIVRQGSGTETEFDFDIITETFSIVAIGSAISAIVCIFIWPMSASQKLRSNIDASLSSTKILLKLLTKTFLLDADLPEFAANKTLETALKSHRTSFTSLKPALKEAKLEFYNLAMKKHADGYHKIVESLERLAQHVGGLKSSCGLQVEVMHQTRPSYYGAIPPNSSSRQEKETYNLKAGPQRKKMETELKREKQDSKTAAEATTSTSYFDIISENPITGNDGNNKGRPEKKEGALVQFIQTVRSPMKSLAYTCKQTIIHLQARFLKKTTHATPSFVLMRQNLASAIELFETSQHQAMIRFYQRRFKKYHRNIKTSDNLHTLFLEQQQEFPADDIFLVYFFVFCLLEFAKELMTLVESVQLVFEDMEEMDKTNSVFAWAKFLFTKNAYHQEVYDTQDMFIPNNNHTINTLHTPEPKTKLRRFLLKLWGFFSEFRTYRVKFAFKSMLTAELISVLAFIPATRPYFTDFKMEWTLITVMAVMMPTVGGTNLGAVLRIFATVLGCILAAVTYTIFHDNTFMLWLFTWLISIPSFWMILNHKHGRFGLFTLLAYNLVVLYKFNHSDDDSINVFTLTWMRCAAVSLGVVIGLIVTAYVWPYEARTQVRKGLSDLLLRLSWLYKQLVSVYSEDGEEDYTQLSRHIDTQSEDIVYPLSLLTRRNKARAIALQKIELSIQLNIFDLQVLLQHAPNEPRLKGPFPAKAYGAMIDCCQSILDKFLSLRIVILKDVWAIHVRRNFLMPASQEFMEMAGNVFLYFYLLASALQLKTPLPPYLPPAEKTRQLLMHKLQELPLVMEESMQQHRLGKEKRDECYMVYYAYVVLMENIIRELDMLGGHMKDLFGSLVPADQWARCFGQGLDLEQNDYIK